MIKQVVLGAALVLGAVPSAWAGGCLVGGAAGAVAGHYAHHSIMGAVGGCLTGHVAWAAYQKYKVTHPGVSFTQFLHDQKDRLQKLGGGADEDVSQGVSK